METVDAEATIEKIGREFERFIIGKVGHPVFSRMQISVKDNISFAAFNESIFQKEHTLFKKLKEDLFNRESLWELERKFRFYRELIILEINHIYKI